MFLWKCDTLIRPSGAPLSKAGPIVDRHAKESAIGIFATLT